MTDKQKEIIFLLFSGCNIATYRNGNARLRKPNGEPVLKLNSLTLLAIGKYLRKDKGCFVIDRRAVRRQHGSSWIKQYYNHIQKITSL
jgi:hypothetical protein